MTGLYVALRDVTLVDLGFESIVEARDHLGVNNYELMIDRELKTKLPILADLYIDLFREKDLLNRLEEENILICSFLVNNAISVKNFKVEVKWVVKVCEAAANYNVSTVRINPVMKFFKDTSITECVKLTSNFVREVLSKTGGLDVSLAMENHGFIGNRREYLRAVLSNVQSERFGLTLDTGNFYWFGYPLNEVYDLIVE
ncbi:MAG TPA: hypothetical protein ENF42_03295, partial [Candidatus Bathyarchaeota archaeon]|nr:hypothetical protein [Candidatus Bathyarchaeota archaeon]